MSTLEEIPNLRSLVGELHGNTGCGLMNAKKALVYFDGNMLQATEFVRMISQPLTRRNAQGKQWNTQDFIDYIKANFV